MGNAYRHDEAALQLQCDRLREQLAEARTDAVEQARLRRELEQALDALKSARLSAAEQNAAVKRVGARRFVLGGLVAGFVLIAGAAAAFLLLERPSESIPLDLGTRREPSDHPWFAEARPHCNPVEASVYTSQHPAPEDDTGQGYLAACQALAHQIDAARGTLTALPAKGRGKAVGIVFDVVHPVADQGDDIAAGPVMELVIEFSPHNYMAVFHAGMSAYGKRDDDRAEAHLARFLTMYAKEDGWRARAKQALDVIRRVKAGEDVERPHIAAH